VRVLTQQINYLPDFFAFVRYRRKNGSTMRVHQLFVDFKKGYDSVGGGGEVLYSILIDFGLPIKVVS
jgi:hypothetical protein